MKKDDLDNVNASLEKFNKNADDVLSSDRSTFDTSLSKFIHWCENDEIVSVICNQLKSDKSIFGLFAVLCGLKIIAQLKLDYLKG